MTQSLENIRKFLLAGMAIFTLTSKKTGDRRTFRVRAAEDVDGSGKPHGWYVDLLVGPNNTTDYRYLCFMWIDRHEELELKQNKESWATDSYRAFGWLTCEIDQVKILGLTRKQKHFEEFAVFDHAGMCARCGRPLTVPESIELGLGPVCAGRQ